MAFANGFYVFATAVVIGLGGKTMGVPRESHYDITAASEVMAILALASDYDDLRQRLSRILCGMTYGGQPVTAESLEGTMVNSIRGSSVKMTSSSVAPLTAPIRSALIRWHSADCIGPRMRRKNRTMDGTRLPLRM